MTSTSEPQPAPGADRRFQFGLKELLFVVLAVAVSCGVLTQVPGAVAVVGILIGWYVFAACILSRQATEGLVAFCMVVALVTGIELVIRPLARVPGRRMTCSNNLKQIAVALHNYHGDYGSFPPAFVADANGKPMHSWRVLVLPYLERQDLFDAYDFSEPWNGHNNRKLAAWCPDVFRCPSDEASAPQTTSYVAVIGPRTVWREHRSTSISEINDGAEYTLSVVECAKSGIHWMEPRDLHVAQMSPTINAQAGQGMSSRHPGGFQAALCDGSVRFWPDDLSAEEVRALLSIDGGEPAPER